MKKSIRHTLLAPCFLTAVFVFSPFRLQAQTYTMGVEEFMSWEEFVTNFFEDLDEGSIANKQGQSETIERLEELHHHPVNINTATREDFLQLPFLSEAQADSILSYREKKRLYRSLGELQWVSGIPYATRCQLSLFIFAGDTLTAQSPILKRFYEGKHDIITRLDFPLYQRAGNKSYSHQDLQDHPNRHYYGHPMANTVRYRYKWRKDIYYGLTLQKDSGEPFAAHGNYPYDYASFYLKFRPLSHRYSLWIGDYNVHLGQGLLLGNSFFYSPVQMTENTALHQSQIRPHTSSDEINYLRGAAATFNIKKNLTLTAFASYRKLDGKIENDTLVSFKTDGQHRSPQELSYRRTIGNFVTGGRLIYQRPKIKIGANAYWSQYDHQIKPKEKAYNKYYLRGKSAAGFSADLSWHTRHWHLEGETAMDKRMHFATTNTLRFTPNTNSSFVLQQHSFSEKFVSPLGSTLQEGSHIQNEHALLIGANLQPLNKVRLTSYFSYFYHPRATYTASQPSHGFEFYLQSRYIHSRHLYFSLRYKVKAEQQNISGHKGLMQYVGTHRSRLSSNYTLRHFSFNASADLAMVTRQTSPTTIGWMISSRNKYALSKYITLHSFAALFFTDDYASRLYAYEPQLQYAASFPTFAYHGARIAGIVQWKFCKHGYAALRYGWLHYFNRDQIGSGPQQIDSSSKNDLSVQLAWRF